MRLAVVFAAPILEGLLSAVMALAAIAWTLRLISPPV